MLKIIGDHQENTIAQVQNVLAYHKDQIEMNDASDFIYWSRKFKDLNDLITEAEENGWTDAKRGRIKRLCVKMWHMDLFSKAEHAVKRLRQ